MKYNHLVSYDHFGHTDVLNIVEVPMQEPGMGKVRIKVKAAGINPGEVSIREGRLEKEFPTIFPSGQGTDFAGIVDMTGENEGQFNIGDEVIGFSNKRSSQAEYVIVPSNHLINRPANVSWEVAGGLFVAGATAYAAVKAVVLQKGETVIVSAAAGGVGSIAVQLAKKQGAIVIGLASESNHQWLKRHGIIPVSYDGNMEENINAVLEGQMADAFIDTAGKGYVEMAIKMNISAGRINTTIDFAAAKKYKVKTDGMSAAGNAEVLSELAEMVNNGELEIPIAKSYPLNQVREAYFELEQHHTHGKIILIP
jgi:NADPH:quinone reductase-like Zn-dependent oxidoreductase